MQMLDVVAQVFYFVYFFCMFEKLHNKKRHNMNASNFVSTCLLTTRWIKVDEHINTEWRLLFPSVGGILISPRLIY